MRWIVFILAISGISELQQRMRFAIGSLGLLLVTACSTKPYVLKSPVGAIDSEPVESIYVVSHGWHTGFIVPSKDVNTELPVLRQRFGEVPFYEFGWGDAGFYQAKQITLGLTLHAIFWPSDTVMHVVAVPDTPLRYFPNSEIVEVSLTRPHFSNLLQFIKQSFASNENGKLIALDNGLYGDSQFYQAEGVYFLFNTCNTWTAKGLSSAGMNVSPAFKLTAGSIMNYLKTKREPAAFYNQKISGSDESGGFFLRSGW